MTARYFVPPDDYIPPTNCAKCYNLIMFTLVINGFGWLHIGQTDHDVVMRSEGWWDSRLGIIRYETYVLKEE